jgi:hypothetical protein
VEKVKGRSQKFHMERFNLKKLKVLGGKVKVPNAFAALEHLDAEVDIYGAWKMIIENIKI